MNVIKRFVILGHRWALEVLLLTVIALIAQISWPSIRHWLRLPAPGRLGFDTCSVSTLAAEFVIRLPPEYYDGLKWPLAVFLHGSGDRGTDSSQVYDCGTLHREFPCIVIGPQCLPSTNWEPDGIVALIHHVTSRYRVDRDRVYLVGYSMGGYGTWQTAGTYSNLFAAIAPICGGGDLNQAKSLVDLPIWAFHGEKDDVIPVAQSKRMVEAIESAGGHPKLTIIPNAGHGICDLVCAREDLWQWLFAQKRRP